jgi:hypothetical protein
MASKEQLVETDWPDHPGDKAHAFQYVEDMDKRIDQVRAAIKRMQAYKDKGWLGRVWWNFGWHGEIYTSCRRVRIHLYLERDTFKTVKNYSAAVYEPGSHGWKSGWEATARTPERAYMLAVRASRKLAKATAKRLLDTVEGL